MIENDALANLIRARLPDAEVQIVDRTGTMDHFNVTVRSAAFSGKTLIEQHQLVYGALRAALKDGRVHAVELKTIVAENQSCPIN
jgi:stress-induced morphogen